MALVGRIRVESEALYSTRKRHGALWRAGDGDGPVFVYADDSPFLRGEGVLFALDGVVAGHVTRWSPRRAHGVLTAHERMVRLYVDALDRLARLESSTRSDWERLSVEVQTLRWGVVSVIAELYPEEVGVGGSDPVDGARLREVVEAGGPVVGGDVGGAVRAQPEVGDRAGVEGGDR